MSWISEIFDMCILIKTQANWEKSFNFNSIHSVATYSVKIWVINYRVTRCPVFQLYF